MVGKKFCRRGTRGRYTRRSVGLNIQYVCGALQKNVVHVDEDGDEIVEPVDEDKMSRSGLVGRLRRLDTSLRLPAFSSAKGSLPATVRCGNQSISAHMSSIHRCNITSTAELTDWPKSPKKLQLVQSILIAPCPTG
jgi:hypothetical protein